MLSTLGLVEEPCSRDPGGPEESKRNRRETYFLGLGPLFPGSLGPVGSGDLGPDKALRALQDPLSAL